jgi:hypothetical protein
MKKANWTTVMTDLIDGVEANLRAAVPKNARVRLREIRQGVTKARTKAGRKKLERMLESFLQEKAYLRGAAKRYVIPKVVATMTAAANAITKATAVLEKYEKRRKK